MRDSDTIESLQDIQVGDEVAYREGGIYRDRPARRVRVTKVTATQIVVESRRFRKRSGTEIGDSRHKSYIYPLGEHLWGDTETWVQRIKTEQAEHNEKQRRDELFNYLRDPKIYRKPLEQLEQAAKLLGFEQPQSAGEEVQ